MVQEHRSFRQGPGIAIVSMIVIVDTIAN